MFSLVKCVNYCVHFKIVFVFQLLNFEDSYILDSLSAIGFADILSDLWLVFLLLIIVFFKDHKSFILIILFSVTLFCFLLIFFNVVQVQLTLFFCHHFPLPHLSILPTLGPTRFLNQSFGVLSRQSLPNSKIEKVSLLH